MCSTDYGGACGHELPTENEAASTAGVECHGQLQGREAQELQRLSQGETRNETERVYLPVPQRDFKATVDSRPRLMVRCEKNGSPARNFTDGMMYVAYPGEGNTYEVNDNFGQRRVILPNELSAHLMKVWTSPLGTSSLLHDQRAVGRFVVI